VGDLETRKPPLNICFLGWGDHVHVERWAGYFARRGHHVSVISVSGKGNYPANVTQFVLGLRSRGLRWKRLRLAYLLWRVKPDVVHVHWAHFASLVTGRWNGPMIVTAWGSDLYRSQEFSAEDSSRLTEALRAAAIITCDSEDLAERIRLLTGNKNGVAVIQWGVDTDVFYPAEPDPEFQRAWAEHGQPVVLSIRNFTPLYNLETIVEAFALVLRQVPEAILLMKKYNSHEGYVQAIQARIAKLGIEHAVRIVEQVAYERMPDLYRMARVTVSVPPTDATPMSLLEAMACGSVPIFTDLPSLREWIRDGHNGYLVAPDNANKLAECILRMLRSPQLAREFAERNCEIVRTRASQAISMDRMERIYRELALQHRPLGSALR
jgi:glycosyltransferase involved in cell wall biosynthesis